MNKTDARFDMMSAAEFAEFVRRFDAQDNDDDFAFEFDASLYSTIVLDDDFAFEFDASLYSTIVLDADEKTVEAFYGAQAQR